jgi:hypothetical protein
MKHADMPDPVVAAHARTDGYWFKDGINEIGLGLSLLQGAAIAAMMHLQAATGRADWPGLVIGLAGVALMFLNGRVKKFLRERFSYPRIGYLSEQAGEPLTTRRKVLAGVVLVVLLLFPAAVLAYLWDRPHQPVSTMFGWLRWFPLVGGPFFLVTAWIDYRRFRLRRIVVDGILSAIAGVASSLLFDAAFLPWAVFGFSCAIIKVAAGTWTLRSIVRTVPVASE